MIYILGNCIAVIALCVFSLVFYLYHISVCMGVYVCVSFTLFFFFLNFHFVCKRKKCLKKKKGNV